LHQAAKSIRSIWDAFLDYEADLTTMIADKPITLLCTYDEAYLASGNGTSRAAASFFTLSKRKVDSRSFFRAQDRAVDDFTMHGTSSRPSSWREAWALFPGSVAYIWHAGTKAGIVQDSLAACDFETRAQIIWAKNNFAIGRGHYHCKHEPCAIRTRFDEIPCSSHEKIL
jgi:hypothetical protein